MLEKVPAERCPCSYLLVLSPAPQSTNPHSLAFNRVMLMSFSGRNV